MSKQATAALEDARTDAPVIDFISFAQKGWPNLRVIHEQFEKAGFPGVRSYDEAKAMYQQSIETFAKSTSVLANGAEEIGHHGLTMMRESFESGIEIAKAIADVKTPQDWFELQSKWIQRFMTSALDQAAKMSGLSVKCSSQAAEPLHAHINDTFGKISKRD